jgi:cell division septal protein FtsQ
MDTPSETTNPRLAQLRRERTLRKRRDHRRWVRLLWRMVVGLALVLVVEVLVSTWVSPRFWVFRIEVKGTDTLTLGEVLRFANVAPGTSYYRVDCDEVAQRVKQGDARVANAVVRQGGIGVLVITVQERKPVCRLEGTGVPLYLDASQFLFTRPKPPKTPVITVQGVPLPKSKPIYQLLNTPEARTAVSLVVKLPRTTPEGRPFPAERARVSAHGMVDLYLEGGIHVLLGKPVALREKMLVLGALLDDAAEKHMVVNPAIPVDERATDITNLNANYKLIAPGGVH